MGVLVHAPIAIHLIFVFSHNKEICNMSWQEWIDTYLMADGKTLEAAIICGQDGSTWAKSAGVDNVTPTEIKTIVAGFGNPSGFYSSGLHFNGKKFMYISGDDTLIRARTADANKTGLHIVKTKSAVVLATYGKDTPAGQVAKTVEGVGDHLKNSGY